MAQQCVLRQMMLFCFLILFPLPAMAISTISLNFAGNGTFLLSGANLEDVGRIEVTVSYDSSLLGNLRLIPKNSFQGATVTLDGDTGGTARLTVNSSKPMKGNGPFAMLVFDQIGASVGFIKSLRGRVYDQSGASLAATLVVTNPTPPLDPSDPDDAPMIKERESKGQSFMGGDVAYMPPEEIDTKERGEQSQTSAEAQDMAAATGESDAAQAANSQKNPAQEKAPEPAVAQAQSMLERFRLFKGERSVKNLTALFKTPDGAFFRQDPPIFLADGKSSVGVTISKVSSDKVLNFSFNSARFVSQKRVSEEEWLVVVRPELGVLSAGITIFTDGVLRKIPLTVSPKVRVDLISPGKVSEADFALFLKERGTASAPRFDLNGDGKRDYLDDYIFTANYLVAQEKQSGKGPTVRQTSERKGEAEGVRLKKN